jgi:hypothetical protein
LDGVAAEELDLRLSLSEFVLFWFCSGFSFGFGLVVLLLLVLVLVLFEWDAFPVFRSHHKLPGERRDCPAVLSGGTPSAA